MKTKYRIKIMRGVHSIDMIYNDWKKITDRMRKERYFQTIEFYNAYINSVDKDPDSVYFFILYDGDNPIAIFPFRKIVWQLGFLQIKVLESLHHPFEMPLYDFIAQEDESGHIFQMFLEKLKDIPEMRWDVLSIMNVLDNSCANLILDNISETKKICYYSTECYYFLTNFYERIIGNTSSNFRRQLKRSKDMLSKSGPSSFTSISKSPELQEAYLRFMCTEASGWKGRLGTAIEQNEGQVGFYRDIILHQSELNSCEIHELKFKDQTIASSLTITCGDTCYLLKMGYDEKFKKLAPGKLLMDYLVKLCCDSRFINELNFISNYSHLDHWKPSHYTQSNYFLFNDKLQGKILYISLLLFLAVKRIPWLNNKFIKPVKDHFLRAKF